MTTRVLSLAAVAAVAMLAPSPAAAQDAKRGEEGYTAQKCQGCHNIAGKGFKNNTLDGVGGKSFGRGDIAASNIPKQPRRNLIADACRTGGMS